MDKFSINATNLDDDFGYLLGQIAFCLWGRVAEEDQAASGAQNAIYFIEEPLDGVKPVRRQGTAHEGGAALLRWQMESVTNPIVAREIGKKNKQRGSSHWNTTFSGLLGSA
jgi:hypothetical protein